MLTVICKYDNKDFVINKIKLKTLLMLFFWKQEISMCSYMSSPLRSGVGVRGQAAKWSSGLSELESLVPPAAAAGRFPDPPASVATETPPSDAAPPAAWQGKREERLRQLTGTAARTHTHTLLRNTVFLHNLLAFHAFSFLPVSSVKPWKTTFTLWSLCWLCCGEAALLLQVVCYWVTGDFSLRFHSVMWWVLFNSIRSTWLFQRLKLNCWCFYDACFMLVLHWVIGHFRPFNNSQIRCHSAVASVCSCNNSTSVNLWFISYGCGCRSNFCVVFIPSL